MSSGGPRYASGDQELCDVYYAVVTQNDGCDRVGARVKVSYPWLPENQRDQSHWAPICVPMVGDEFGTYTLPEVGDAVFVVFVGGNIHHPVVIGGAWSKRDRPPEENDGCRDDFRVIKSRSGHRLLFDDSSETKILLADHKNENLISTGSHEVGGRSRRNEDRLPAPGGINGTPEKGVSAAAATGTLNIWCPNGTLSIEGNHVEVTAEKSVNIKVGSTTSIEAGSKAGLTSERPGTFQGNPTKFGP